MDKKRRLNSLGSLRFIAAAMIVVHHSRGLFGVPEDLSFPFGLVVSFFFILSGFILTYAYPDLPTPQARKEFWVARFSRIWPAHFVTFLAIIIFVKPATMVDWPIIRASNIFLLQSWIPYPEFYFAFNAVSWAVSTELSFYLLFPFLIKNFKSTWHIKLLSSLAIVVLFVWACNYFGLAVYSTDPFVISTHGIIYINPLARLFEFVLGMVFSLLFKKLSQTPSPRPLTATSVEVLVLSIAVINLVKAPQIIRFLWSDLSWIGSAGRYYLIQNSMTCFSFGLLILFFSLEAGYLSRLLAQPFFVLMGELSYAIYLVHQIIVRMFFMHLGLIGNIPDGVLATFFVALTLAFSYILWACVEQPWRYRLKRLILEGPSVPMGSAFAKTHPLENVSGFYGLSVARLIDPSLREIQIVTAMGGITVVLLAGLGLLL